MKIYVIGVIALTTLIVLISSQRLATGGHSFRNHWAPVPVPGSKPLSNSRISNRKAAAIVENRPLDNLIPIILHFSSVLGPEWPIHVFTNEDNIGNFSESTPFQRQVADGRFHVQTLPRGEALNTHASVSGFFTKPWFWEQLAPYEHILIFQADTIICSNSPQKVEDFLEYDFVGAPIDDARGMGMGYNGGLSIRNRTKCLEITNSYDWQVERHGDGSQGNVDYEDQWFSKKMRELPKQLDGRPGANLPPADIAMKFSVETMWYDKPLGYHQPNVWQNDHMAEIHKWCPEYRMCTTETFADHNPENFGDSSS
ncbi:uncharacterized protein BP5553_04074 [Venustampulla echinocandica]|uniref:DUF5672 domain-containing protein n=1 Tax=Venustampulla echinocandica TaxID=2656787 RepID=A0A370TW28_9HELO|nr:uncharacterized protein BP5553_04074 [Venustampulla echinocandica]RDL39734.1 hypothetical protein BP5553_04074 [Venustampulla echinocandica]